MDLLTYYENRVPEQGKGMGRGRMKIEIVMLQRKTFANTKTSLKNILKSCIPRPLCRAEEDPLSV